MAKTINIIAGVIGVLAGFILTFPIASNMGLDAPKIWMFLITVPCIGIFYYYPQMRAKRKDAKVIGLLWGILTGVLGVIFAMGVIWVLTTFGLVKTIIAIAVIWLLKFIFS